MTRKQNAIMDRKYRKVVTKQDTGYLDKLNKALILTEVLKRTHPADKNLAIHLANDGRLKSKVYWVRKHND